MVVRQRERQVQRCELSAIQSTENGHQECHLGRRRFLCQSHSNAILMQKFSLRIAHHAAIHGQRQAPMAIDIHICRMARRKSRFIVFFRFVYCRHRPECVLVVCAAEFELFL